VSEHDPLPSKPPSDARPPGPISPSPADGPLTAEHYQALAQANLRARKVHKCASVATFNAYTIGILAGGSLVIALGSAAMGEWNAPALLISAVLGALAVNEFRGRAMIRRFDLGGPAVLGWNQVALMAVIIAYCAWMLARGLLGPNEFDEQMRGYPELESVLGNVGNLYRTITLLVYGLVIVGTIVFQGINAWYYFGCAKHLRAYLEQTPPWVVQLQRATAGAERP